MKIQLLFFFSLSIHRFSVENWDRTDEEIIPKPVQSNNQEERLRKKSKLRQAIAQSKPTFDPSIRKKK